MPAKMRSSMPDRKRPQKVLSDKNENYDREAIFGEPACRIMKEMGVRPLEEDSYYSNYDFDDFFSEPKIKKTGQGHSKSLPQTKNNIWSSDIDCFRNTPSQQTSEFSPFSSLSDDVIIHIFRFLPKATLVRCLKVCKRWRDLGYETTFWKRYDFGRRLVKPHVLGILLPRGVNTLRLAMSDIRSPVFPSSFNPSSTWCSRLQYLDLSMATVSASGVAEILSVCRLLIKLSVENCTLNEDCCRNIAENVDLTVLNMAMCSGVTSNGLQLISKQCTKLLEWNLGWSNLALECMDKFLPYLPTGLKRINLSGHRDSLDDQGLIDVVTRCRNLIELDISDCPLLTQVSFEVMINTCEKLKHLHSSRSYNIPTRSLRLLKNLKKLKNFELFKTLTDDAFKSLCESLPDVKMNKHVFSTIARPTTGIRRTSLWGMRSRD